MNAIKVIWKNGEDAATEYEAGREEALAAVLALLGGPGEPT